MKDYYIAFHRPDLPGNQLVACKVSIGDYLIDRGDDEGQGGNPGWGSGGYDDLSVDEIPF